MDEEDLITLTTQNYKLWSQLVLTYLSQHNALPYAKGLSYNGDTSSIICLALFLHMDMEVMDSLDDMKSTIFYDIWIYLWEMYGDPHIPPFPQDLLPPVVVASSLDEITPLDASVAITDIVPAIDDSNSLH